MNASVLIVDHREVVRRGVASMVGSFARVGCCRCVATFEDVKKTFAAAGDRAGKVDRFVDTESYDIAIAPVAAYLCFGDPVPARRSIALIESSSPQDLEAAAQAHADGYLLLAEVTASSLRSAVGQVLDNLTFVPQVLAGYLLERSRRSDSVATTGSIRLSPREAEVLDLICAGLSNKQIATRLDVSIHGAKRQVSSLLSKFNVPSRSYLIAQVLQLNGARR